MEEAAAATTRSTAGVLQMTMIPMRWGVVLAAVVVAHLTIMSRQVSSSPETQGITTTVLTGTPLPHAIHHVVVVVVVVVVDDHHPGGKGGVAPVDIIARVAGQGGLTVVAASFKTLTAFSGFNNN